MQLSMSAIMGKKKLSADIVFINYNFSLQHDNSSQKCGNICDHGND